MRRSLLTLLAGIFVFSGAIFGSPSPAPASTIIITPDGYTPPPIKIAVVRSETTLWWLRHRRTPGKYPHSSKELTLLAYLKGRGYDVTQIIGDRDLRNLSLLKRYDVVVLPEVFAMSRSASTVVAKYVAQGGGLVGLGATPRAAPEYANPRGTKNDMRDWWCRVYKSNVWEWGPLSQAYQMKMINDAWTPPYQIRPNSQSSIITSASAILQARGISGGAAVTLLRTPGAGLELTKKLRNNHYVQNICDFYVLNSKIRRQYRGTYSAGSAARYYAGRTVHFYFGLNEFFKNYSTRLWGIRTSTGVPQGEVAGAWVESAIQWAAVKDGKTGPTTNGVTARARVTATRKGIYSRITVHNGSPLITYGTMRLKIFTRTGRRVHSYKRNRVITQPGDTVVFRHMWKRRLGGMHYRISVSYESGYPVSSRRSWGGCVVSRGHSVRAR